MLAKQFRLPSSVHFSTSRTVSEKEFTVKIQPNALSIGRFGFIVSKAIDKRATVRNRLKRVLRSCIEEQWLGKKGWDMLFIIRPGAKTIEKPQLQEKVDKILENL